MNFHRTPSSKERFVKARHCLAALLRRSSTGSRTRAHASRSSLRDKGTRAPSLLILAPLALALAALLAVSATSALAALPAEFGGPVGSGAGQFEQPQGIAVNQETGDSYVADTQNNRVDKFGPNGEFLLGWGWGVADGTTEALQTCTTTCFAGIAGAGAGQFGPFSAQGIAVDNDVSSASHGDVYVLDGNNSRIEKFSPSGAFLLQFGEAGTGAGQFERLNGFSVAVGPAGSVYVADEDRVQIFSPGGVVESQIPLNMPGVFNEALAVDSTGDFYVKPGFTEFGEQTGVHKYDPAGTELGSPRDGPERRPGSLAIGPNDELFVNDRAFDGGVSHVLEYGLAGEQLAAFNAGDEGTTGIALSKAAASLFAVRPSSVHVVALPAPGPLLLAGSQSATEVEPISALLGATLNPEGVETTYHFVYGTTTAYGSETAPQTLGADFEDHAVSSPIASLQPRTIYHFAIVAESECEPVASPGHICLTTGPDAEFETLPPVSALIESVSQVSSTAAKLLAEFNPHGLATQYHFDYGPTAAYGSTVPVPDATTAATNGTVSVATLVQALQPGTTYHYRLVAVNDAGIVEGPDQTFSTPFVSSLVLPDGRGWELVSPQDKHGYPLSSAYVEGSLIQASADGEAITYVALGPATGETAGTRPPTFDQLFSSRSSAGWATADITPAHEEVTGAVASHGGEYLAFSPDLSRAVLSPTGLTHLTPYTTERTPFIREADGSYRPLLVGCPAEPIPCPIEVAAHANVPSGVAFGAPAEGHERIIVVGASTDLEHVILQTRPGFIADSLVPGFEADGRPVLYDWSGGNLQLASILPDGHSAAEDGLNAVLGFLGDEGTTRNSVSADGDRVVFTAAPEGGGVTESLNLRQFSTGQTLQIAAGQGSEVVAYQTASADDSRVFFSSGLQLTPESSATPEEPDLYMCEVIQAVGHLACDTTDLSLSVNPGEPANVLGRIVGASDDGSAVYFVATGVLATNTSESGETAQAGQPNLYLSHAGRTTFIATLGADNPDWAEETTGGVNARQLPSLTKLTDRVSPNGEFVAFMSERSLTGYDNRDARSGVPDQEVYLYSRNPSAGRPHLVCVSCNPTGARPTGLFIPETASGPDKEKAVPLVDRQEIWKERWLSGSIPGWTPSTGQGLALVQPRYLSDAGRVFFDSNDALVPRDSNGVEDVYEYEPVGVGTCTSSEPTYSTRSGGCVNLVSSGAAPGESVFLDASESGDDAFFLTPARLTPRDIDGALDVYDAHVGGGETALVKPVECQGDACQQPATVPDDATPGSLTFSGAGNVLECPKGKVKQKGKCVKKQKQKKKKSKKHKKSNTKSAKQKGKNQKSKRATDSKHGGQK
jgi:hypothetical protein